MSSAARPSPPRISPEAFLSWPGDGTADRHPLFDGEIRAMSPARPVHGRIQSRLVWCIERRLIETSSRCIVLTKPPVVPKTGARHNLRVPHLAVTCTPLLAGQRVVADPVLLIEILSPGNEAQTRQNVRAYTTIPSVLEILVVQSVRIGAERLRRDAVGAWPDDPQIIGTDDLLHLDSIDLTCPLREIDAGTFLATGAA
jgi:Uma2 family endonuclease